MEKRAIYTNGKNIQNMLGRINETRTEKKNRIDGEKSHDLDGETIQNKLGRMNETSTEKRGGKKSSVG